MSAIKRRKLKEYTLSDGSIATWRDVVNRTGVSESTARKRLINSDNPEVVFSAKGVHAKKVKTLDELSLDDNTGEFVYYSNRNVYIKVVGDIKITIERQMNWRVLISKPNSYRKPIYTEIAGEFATALNAQRWCERLNIKNLKECADKNG